MSPPPHVVYDCNIFVQALVTHSKLIVSRDKDLLSLMDLAQPEGKDFRARFPDLRILNPVAFLRDLEKRAAPPD
jgi:hypothetical protein